MQLLQTPRYIHGFMLDYEWNYLLDVGTIYLRSRKVVNKVVLQKINDCLN